MLVRRAASVAAESELRRRSAAIFHPLVPSDWKPGLLRHMWHGGDDYWRRQTARLQTSSFTLPQHGTNHRTRTTRINIRLGVQVSVQNGHKKLSVLNVCWSLFFSHVSLSLPVSIQTYGETNAAVQTEVTLRTSAQTPSIASGSPSLTGSRIHVTFFFFANLSRELTTCWADLPLNVTSSPSCFLPASSREVGLVVFM